MITKTEDLRVRRTKEAIYSAFKTMVMEMDADKITIRELTKRANIHYKTFYLHYTCIEALFQDVIGQMLQEYYQVINEIPDDAPFTETNRVFFEFMAKQEPYIEKMILSPSYQSFMEKGFLAMLKHNRSRYNPYANYTKEEQNIINTFLGGTSVNMYRQWIIDGKKIPLDILIELSGQLLSNGIESVKAKSQKNRSLLK